MIQLIGNWRLSRPSFKDLRLRSSNPQIKPHVAFIALMRAQAEGLKYLSMIPRLCIREISLQSQYGHALPENPLGATCENPFVATAASRFSRDHDYCILSCIHAVREQRQQVSHPFP